MLAGFGATLARSTARRRARRSTVAPTSYSTRFGLGVDYYLTENIALNLGSEFVVNTAKISNTSTATTPRAASTTISAQGGLIFKF